MLWANIWGVRFGAVMLTQYVRQLACIIAICKIKLVYILCFIKRMVRLRDFDWFKVKSG